MQLAPPPTTILHGYRPGLPLRLAIIASALVLEKMLLNSFVDFERADAAQGFGAILRVLQHVGFRFLVSLAAAIALFAYVRDGQRLIAAKVAIKSAPVRIGWLVGHAAAVAALVLLTHLLFGAAEASPPLPEVAVLWLAIGCIAAASAFLAMAPARLWLDAARALGTIWCYATIAALVSAAAMQLSQRLWTSTSAITFDLVRLVLMPALPELESDPATQVLRSSHFAVQVSDVCSGLEGMALILAFTVAWLVYFRREYIFPRALLLIPLGLLIIFSLNVLRIAALMLIGDAGYPDVAIYGFHSQAGWIAFNAVACGLVFFSRRAIWLNRSAATSSARESAENPTAAYLMPLLAVLSAGILSRAFSGGFESLYALRLIAGLAFLRLYWPKLAEINWRWSWRGPAGGVVVFIIWMTAAHFTLPNAGKPPELSTFSPIFRALWFITRVAAAILVVPIAEELAYRGYLMRRLINADFEAVSYRAVGRGALCMTSIAFGLAHGAMWLPGICAGMAFGFLAVRRDGIGEAVAAHITANSLIAATVIGWDQWQLW